MLGEAMFWILLALDWCKWWTVVKIIMSLQVARQTEFLE
jgi:hypothetical protein